MSKPGPYASYLPQERKDNAEAILTVAQKELALWTAAWDACDRTDPDECYYVGHRLAGAAVAVRNTEQYIKDGCRRVPGTA